MACSGFILLLTPAGQLPSLRWRWWAAVTAGTPQSFLLLVIAAVPQARRPACQALSSPLDLQALDGGLLAAYLADPVGGHRRRRSALSAL